MSGSIEDNYERCYDVFYKIIKERRLQVKFAQINRRETMQQEEMERSLSRDKGKGLQSSKRSSATNEEALFPPNRSPVR
jgi:hypothetical protein